MINEFAEIVNDINREYGKNRNYKVDPYDISKKYGTDLKATAKYLWRSKLSKLPNNHLPNEIEITYGRHLLDIDEDSTEWYVVCTHCGKWNLVKVNIKTFPRFNCPECKIEFRYPLTSNVMVGSIILCFFLFLGAVCLMPYGSSGSNEKLQATTYLIILIFIVWGFIVNAKLTKKIELLKEETDRQYFESKFSITEYDEYLTSKEHSRVKKKSNIFKVAVSGMLLLLGIVFIYNNQSISIFDAAKGGNTSDVRNYIIKNGIKINTKDGKGNTALMIAANHGHAETVKMLIDANSDINIRNTNGETALTLAANHRMFENGYNDSVKLLIDAKCNLNIKNINGDTALTLAAGKGNESVANELLFKDCDIDIANKNGDTALMLAASVGSPGIVEMLIRLKEIAMHHNNSLQLNGINNYINAKNNRGDTALMQAISKYDTTILPSAQDFRTKTIKMLIDANSNVNIKNNNGDTAVTLAAGIRNAELVKMLIAAKCDVNIKNNKGKTPLMLVKGHADIVKLLIDAGAKE
jgi:ankyrin repeat protein